MEKLTDHYFYICRVVPQSAQRHIGGRAVTLSLQMRKGRPKEDAWQPDLECGSHGPKFSS